MTRLVAGVLAWLVVLLSACATRPEAAVAPAPRLSEAPDRRLALWVSRWDFRSPADVDRILDDAVSIGVTDVLWQARGVFDAYYESSIEPWGEAFGPLDADGVGPGFDPLRLATEGARERGVRVHAWVNVFSLWRGETPPRDSTHAFIAQPAWGVYDQSGRPPPSGSGYRWANVAIDPVHDRVIDVLVDIAGRYDIAGIHLDQMHAGVVDAGGRLFPGDTGTLELFRRATGRTSLDTPSARGAYRAWLRDRVTRLARRVRAEVAPVSRGLEVSVTTPPRPGIARERALQDAAGWFETGAIDRVYLRGRSLDAEARDAWAAATRPGAVTAGVSLGVLETEDAVLARLRELDGPGGLALFAYAAVFESGDPAQPQSPAAVTDRLVRRQAMRAWREEWRRDVAR